jgi:hypothetical protein
MKINDVKPRKVNETMSDQNKSDIKKIQSTGKAKTRPLVKLAKMGNKKLKEQNTTTDNPQYLVTDKKGRYFLFSYQSNKGGNPMHLRNTIDAKGKELGFDRSHVIAQWKGDIDAAIETADSIAAEYKDKKDSFPTQYHDNVKKAETLRMAKDVMADETLEEGEIEEARNPLFAINKFLDDKKAKEDANAERGERLRKERDAPVARDPRD